MSSTSIKRFNLQELCEKGVSITLSSQQVKDHPLDDFETVPDYTNIDCITITDDDTLEEGGPFEILAKKMQNLTPDGKIKKRVLLKGNGVKAKQFSRVKIHYNAYKEFSDVPFDSTYLSKHPKRFFINKGEVIPGLDYGVYSMEVNEKSQFLIHPDHAYGKCFIGRTPTDTILFEVELLEVIDLGFVSQFEHLPEEEQQKFSNVYQYCVALSNQGKSQFNEHKLDKAIISYNTAIAQFDKTKIETREDDLKYRELYLKLLINLLVCQTTEKPKKGKITAEKIYKFTENGLLMKIPPKVYFCHAKCLRLLNDCEEAYPILEKARQLDPKNVEIAYEFILLDSELKDMKKQREKIAKNMFKEQNTSE